jgi:hypothetical protein
MPDLQEGFWDNLLDYIQDRTVIPVIGPELVTVRENGQDVPLYRWIAQRLAVDLRLPTADLPEGFELNDVVSMHLRRRGEREELYAQIHRMLRNAALKPSESLRTLAGIPGFDLYISLTFDSLLADAIGGAQQIAYSPNAVRDLVCPKGELRQPVVFHLLGRSSASPDYAICDDDVLEFLHTMQDRQRQPKRLFDELGGNHLLFLGCSFGDWFWRTFLRTARGLELSQKRRRWDVLVGEQVAHDDKLALFLESFSPDTRVVPLAAAQFVTELAARWHAAYPATAQSTEPGVREKGARESNIPKGAIFVSYVSEDLEAASRLADGLRAEGLEVWFDRDALQTEDVWARRIRLSLERCSIFLPVISRHALSEENRRDRYFWREWKDADDLTRAMAGEAFIIPVVIDDTRIDPALLPDSFKRVQSMSLPGGKVTPEAAKLLVGLVRDFHRRQRAADAESLSAIPVRSGVGRKHEGTMGRAAPARSIKGEGKPKETAVQADRAPAAPVQTPTGLPPSCSGQGDYFFISYKREDTARLSSILRQLVGWGHNIWYDKGIPGGAEWDSMIESRLQRCKLLILFISKAAINSKNVRKEVKYAEFLDKPLIAVRLEETELKHGLAMLFGSNQTIDGMADDCLEQLQRAIEYHLHGRIEL